MITRGLYLNYLFTTILNDVCIEMGTFCSINSIPLFKLEDNV